MEKTSNPLLAGIDFLYDLLVFVGNHFQSFALLLIRFGWGIQLAEGGLGKLLDIQKPIDYFTSLGIPFPVQNAYLVGCTETVGGTFLALGLLTRLTAIPVLINFIVAYITTEQEGLKDLLYFNSDKFSGDDAFPYLVFAIVMLAFGPGAISIDFFIASWRKREWKSIKFWRG